MLGNLSRLLARLIGGQAGETLCHLIAARFGPSCWFSLVIGGIARDKNHCFFFELDGYPPKD